MKHKLLSLVTLGLFVISNSLLGQQDLSNPVEIPPSPSAEAFMKYGDYNVNYSTGVPNISVPLYEINHHGFKIPMNLSYYYQGLKPGYNVDVFGLGWGVNPTGKISRTIRYAADDDASIDFVVNKANVYSYSHSLLSGLFNNPRSQNHSPDLFNVSLPTGLSFEFIMTKNNNNEYEVLVSDGEPVVVNYTKPSTSSEGKVWEIIDAEGVKYIFLEEHGEKVIFGANANKISTWNLSRIELPNSNEPIEYTYINGIQNQFLEPGINQCISTYDQSCISGSAAPSPMEYQTDLLKGITYGTSYIDFNYKYAPLGVNEFLSHNYIESIDIGEFDTDVNNVVHKTTIRNVNFTLSNHNSTVQAYDVDLMRLDNIYLSGKNYSFEYQPFSSFPSASTDHWGYLNNDSSPLALGMPDFYISLYNIVDASSCLSAGSDLEEVSSHAHLDGERISEYKLGSSSVTKSPGGSHGELKSIYYPTGGHTEFKFEGNKYGIQDVSNHTSLNEIRPATGFRIAEIINYTSDTQISSRKIYKYGELNNQGVHTGLGIAPVEPNGKSYLNFKYYGSTYNGTHDFLNEYESLELALPIEVVFEPGEIDQGAPSAGIENCFSSKTFLSILNGRSPVVYPEVTVYSTNEFDTTKPFLEKTLGKTVYKYDYFDIETDVNGNVISKEFIEPWFVKNDGASYAISKSYRYNRLLEQVDYKREEVNGIQTYIQIKKTENRWDYQPQDIFTENKIIRIVPSFLPTNYDGLQTESFYEELEIDTEQKRAVLLETVTTESIGGADIIVEKQTMQYNDDGFLKIGTTEHNNGKEIIVRNTYPTSYGSSVGGVIGELQNNHIISPVIASSTHLKSGPTESEVLVSSTKVDYKEFTTSGTSTMLLPEKQYQTDKSGEETLVATVLSYTENGKPKEVLKKDGTRTRYVWGYQGRYLIAVIENYPIPPAAYPTFYDGIFDVAIAKSDLDIDRTIDTLNPYDIPIANGTEGDLREALRGIRGEPDFEELPVTTFTYDPMVGVTSRIDPTGVITYYEYDAFHRLIAVKDKDGNILSENTYHYRD